MPEGRLPDALYVGLPRAGSTWLYTQLRRHPGVVLPEAKETFFFDKFYDRGLGWYRECFPAREGTAIELSHDYFFNPVALSRIRSDLPAVRIILFLREPVTWLESVFSSFVLAGQAKATTEDFIRVMPFMEGDFSRPLERLFGLFGVERVKVVLHERIRDDGAGVLREISDHLELAWYDPWEETAREVVNAQRQPRSQTLSRAGKSVANVLRRLDLAKVVQKGKESAALRRVFSRAETERFRAPDEIRAQLRAYYQPDIERVAALLPEADVIERWSCP